MTKSQFNRLHNTYEPATLTLVSTQEYRLS